METLINEGLMLISTVIVLPVAAVLTFAFFTGRLTKTENTKFTVFIEQDEDYWAVTDAPTAKDRAGVARSTHIEGGASA